MANIFAERKAKEERILTSMRNIKHLIAVCSGKGGVGKSTVAANLAVALAQKGYRVGLADADIYGPSIPTLFNISDAEVMGTEIEGQSFIVPFERFGIKLMSIGFFVDKDRALIWRGPMASGTLNQLFVETLWGELDYLVIDTPPGTGDIQLTLVQDYPVSAALFVATPQEVAVADVRRAVNMYRNEQINIPVLGLVENMAYFTPAELPNNKYYIFGKDGVKHLAEELNLEVLLQIPISESVSQTNDSGNPIALDFESMEGKAFGKLASMVSERLK